MEAQVLYRYFLFLFTSPVDSIITAAQFVPLPSDIKSTIVNLNYLSKWICTSGVSAVTSDSVDLVAAILLSLVGFILSVGALGIVLSVAIRSHLIRRKELNSLKDEDQEHTPF